MCPTFFMVEILKEAPVWNGTLYKGLFPNLYIKGAFEMKEVFFFFDKDSTLDDMSFFFFFLTMTLP